MSDEDASDDPKKVKVLTRALMCWNPNWEMPEDIEMDPLFVGLLLRLPKTDAEWSRKQREAWLKMFNAVADGLHPESLLDDKAFDRYQNEQLEEGLAEAGVVDVPSLPDPNLANANDRFRPYAGSKDAAHVAVEMIRQAGKPGHIWYDKVSGRIRICAEDYAGEPDEILVGVYDVNVKAGRIGADIKALRREVMPAVNSAASQSPQPTG